MLTKKLLGIVRVISFSVLFVVSLALSTQAATTDLGACTIITPSATTTISSPGFYCLDANSSLDLASETAITINASNVVLDLNGYTMTNTNGANTALAIGTTSSPSNVTINNGKIIGYRDGIGFKSGAKYTIDSINIDVVGKGIDIRADNTIIRNSFIKGDYRGIIICKGYSCILNNEIVSNGGGIDSCIDSVRMIIDGNKITTPAANGGNGIFLGELNNLVVNNRFVNWTVGIQGDVGSSKYMDNLFINVTTKAVGITDAGNNK